MSAPVLALDIGGTKLAAALVGPQGGVHRFTRRPTRTGRDAEALYDDVVTLLDDVRRGVDIAGVGVGCGGPMRWPAGEVSPLNIPAWDGFPLREMLTGRYPARPVRVHNDAACVAVGEHWRGAGRRVADLIGMVVSTGVGGGLVLGGRLVDGATGNAGHIGHVVVDADGPPCACGGRGCLEAVASGPAIAAWAVELGWRTAGATARELADDAQAGDAIAVAAMARAGIALGIGIASAVQLCDLELVIVGGGVAQAGPLLFDPLEAAYQRHAGLGFARVPRVVAAALGEQAGLVGAAALVLAGTRYWSAD
ncbi:MAG TPA: ROK family protein [Mycobacteriales bacterium]|nr:ROK family protein [Mycobacteriales bacterium]